MACLSFLQDGELRGSLSYRLSLCFMKINRDQYLGFQLYQSDPSGNYAGWKVSGSSPVSTVQRKGSLFNFCQATSIGANSQTAHSILKSDYNPNLSLDGAKKLALKVLKKIMDVTTVSYDTVELIEITLQGDGISSRCMSESEIMELNALQVQSYRFIFAMWVRIQILDIFIQHNNALQLHQEKPALASSSLKSLSSSASKVYGVKRSSGNWCVSTSLMNFAKALWMFSPTRAYCLQNLGDTFAW